MSTHAIYAALFGGMTAWEQRRWYLEQVAVLFAADHWDWQSVIYDDRNFASLVWC